MSDTDRLNSALSGRYRIERQLGQGGMATVYLAQDLKHERKVALKILKPELSAALGHDRFAHEIRTTAGLSHPHILPLFDSGEADGLLFYAMTHVEGESLRDRLLREKQLPVDEALAIATQVADALGHAHARGIIHRDIKPENILLAGGHALVADFGIALAVSAAEGGRLTQTGTSLGTPLYMSPEQAGGDRTVDERSDLYSLGCVLYEMLGGHPPFTGPTFEAVARQHITIEAPPVTNLRPAVPPGVVLTLARLLAKNPADRLSSAARLVEALKSPNALGEPVTRWSVRRLGVSAVAAMAAVAALWFGGRWAIARMSAPRYERLAVLPLENQTGDTARTFFAAGMTRELISVLTDAGVRVLGHRAVAPYAGTQLPLDRIARDLNVDALVTGTVLQAGDDVQVAVELIDPRTGENLWARTFTRPAPEVVSLQRDVAREIARGVRARLTSAQEQILASASRVDPRAYALYLLGAEQANFRTPAGFRKSIEHLSKSITLDSTFAPAWAALAMSSSYALIYQTGQRDSARSLLERAARQAMALDDRLGDPYVAVAMARLHSDWNFTGAEEMFAEGRRRSLSTQALALYLWVVWDLRRWEEIERTAVRLVELEPTTAQWWSDLAWGYWSARDSAKARTAAERAVALDSTYFEAHDLLGIVLAEYGEFEAADREHRSAIRHSGGEYWVRRFNQGMISAARGDRETVRRMLRELEGDSRLAQRAGLLYLAGDKEGMYAMLDRAIAARDPDLLVILNAMPFLYAIRDEPRYRAVLARVGFRDESRGGR